METFERLALQHKTKFLPAPLFHRGRLHWGQANGVMTAADVKAGYPAANLAAWKKAQKHFGGSTFVNELMRRCGLVG